MKCGKLIIGTTPFRASTLLSKSIAAFHSEYPQVDISIVENSADKLERGLSNGEIDILICSGEFDSYSFHREELADETLYIAVSEENPINAQLSDRKLCHTDICENALKILKIKPCGIELFKNERFILLRQSDNFSVIANKVFNEKDIIPHAALQAQNLYTAMSFVLEGLGVTLIPDTMIKYGNIKNHPCYYALDSVFAKNSICLLYKKNRYLSKAATEYSKILKQLIQIGTWRI